jgi:hypothetical protein
MSNPPVNQPYVLRLVLAQAAPSAVQQVTDFWAGGVVSGCCNPSNVIQALERGPVGDHAITDPLSKAHPVHSTGQPEVRLFDNWFDPTENGVRD